MEIKIKRFAFKPTYTIGRLSIDGKDYCDSLEPVSARITNYDAPKYIKAQKAAHTVVAIPTGTYRVKLAMSQKFHRAMPFLVDVPCFKGIMIHPGNYPRDTHGCILPGWNRRRGMVCGSISAFSPIYHRIADALMAGDKVTVKVVE